MVEETKVDASQEIDGEHIRAELVANVWKVLVSEGDAVVEGETLVILESMKMEIPVVSEVDGKVARIVEEGRQVDVGDLIAIVQEA